MTLLIHFKNSGIINLDQIQYLYIKDSSLVCTIPSAESSTGYENVYLGVSGEKANLVLREIIYKYKQYIVNNDGIPMIPPKVYEIEPNVTYLSNSDVYVVSPPNWDSQKLMTGSRLFMEIKVMNKHTGAPLYEGRDYTAEYPLYKGDGVVHCITLNFPKSRTHYSYLFYSSLKSKI